jgi:hypothetical protein
MTVDAWLAAALADADRRALPDLKPMLEALARAMQALREADFNEDAGGGSGGGDAPPR